MSRRCTRLGAVAVVTLIMGCADTGQDAASVPLYVAGTDTTAPILSRGDVPVSIGRADLAFGPLYLCAGANAGDLCETARFEWLETTVVDATNVEVVSAGELLGVTGPVRSWMYDLGISSQLTRRDPFILDAAQALGGSSLVMEGVATVEGIAIPFAASVPIQQTDTTELGVPVIRKSTSDRFSRDVGGDERGLVVRFDAATWVRGMDFRPYVTRELCEADGPSVACDGTIERRCEGVDEMASRDCAELGQVCLPAEGCAARLNIEPESELYRSLRNALVSGDRPEFEWDNVP